MAHFARLDSNNIVTAVHVVNNETVNNLPYPESEPVGVTFLRNLYGVDSNWAQTSYNSSFRYNFAGPNFVFDTINDAFIPPSPYPSWILDTSIYDWMPPIPCPQDGKKYDWDETVKNWVLVVDQ